MCCICYENVKLIHVLKYSKNGYNWSICKGCLDVFINKFEMFILNTNSPNNYCKKRIRGINYNYLGMQLYLWTNIVFYRRELINRYYEHFNILLMISKKHIIPKNIFLTRIIPYFIVVLENC